MKIRFFFKNMSASEEKRLQDYASKKIPKIQKFISYLPDDGVFLTINGEKFIKHNAFDVELVLKMPSRTFIGREASHAITKAVDLAAERLAAQIAKFEKEKTRKHRSIKMKSRDRSKAYKLRSGEIAS